MSGTLIAIPALNEAATIATVIDEVRGVVPFACILVVDDGSTDETAMIASRHGARVLRLSFNVGVGGAMRSAFRFAAANDFDHLVQVDADGQHVAAFIPALLRGLDTASIVVGGRFGSGPAPHGEEAYYVPRHRRIAMRLLSRLLESGCGASVLDTTSGFRASDRRAIALFAHHYPAEYLGDTVESLVIAARSGLVVGEVPVEMRPRQGGQPSHSLLRSALHMGRVVLATTSALTRQPIPGPPVSSIRQAARPLVQPQLELLAHAGESGTELSTDWMPVPASAGPMNPERDRPPVLT